MINAINPKKITLKFTFELLNIMYKHTKNNDKKVKKKKRKVLHKDKKQKKNKLRKKITAKLDGNLLRFKFRCKFLLPHQAK